MNKVKVCVAVSVDPSGSWCAAGWNGPNRDGSEGKDAIQYTTDTLTNGEKHYILNAVLEIPETLEVNAVVSESKQ